MSNFPPDMRATSLVKRTPDGPRCGSELPNALGILHLTRSWALTSLVVAVNPAADRHNATPPQSPSLSQLLDIGIPPCSCLSKQGHAGARLFFFAQIGRASCRERV